MKKITVIGIVLIGFASCKEKATEKAFQVSGTITNNSAVMIYLEKLEMGTEQGVLVDSAKVGKDGNYLLQSGTAEACVFNLRLDKSGYPFAAVINDVNKITVDVSFSKDNKEFPEKYEVKGSAASTQMKDFMFAFNSKLQAIYFTDQLSDSLQKASASDSAILAMQQQRMQVAADAKNLVQSSLQQSNNPSLTMFILGYYLSLIHI